MKRVGILVGREQTFPESIINSINEKGGGEVVAEMVTIGGITLDEPKRYDVVIDRISHEIPYYRATLKRFALGHVHHQQPVLVVGGRQILQLRTRRQSSASRSQRPFFCRSIHISKTSRSSLARDPEFPLDWQGIVDHVGFPAFLKPFDGGGWKNVSKIHNIEELMTEYNQSGTLCMTLQEGIEYDHFVRCYCVGKEKVLIMPYDPSKPYLSGMQYVNVDDYLSPELHARVEQDVITICTALGYDLNTVEFAIKDGIPYAIDFMNPAPDAELASVGEYNHRWIVDNMTDFILKKLETGWETPEYRWSAMLNPPETPAKSPRQKLRRLSLT